MKYYIDTKNPVINLNSAILNLRAAINELGDLSAALSHAGQKEEAMRIRAEEDKITAQIKSLMDAEAELNPDEGIELYSMEKGD